MLKTLDFIICAVLASILLTLFTDMVCFSVRFLHNVLLFLLFKSHNFYRLLFNWRKKIRKELKLDQTEKPP